MPRVQAVAPNAEIALPPLETRIYLTPRDDITVAQPPGLLFEALARHEGTVGAAEILDVRALLSEKDVGMAPGDVSELAGELLPVPCENVAGLSPVAGSLFAVEIILGDFGMTQFSPIVISSVVATVISRAFIGG